MPAYALYGLTVHCPYAFAGLTPISNGRPVDITVHLDSTPQLPLSWSTVRLCSELHQAGFDLAIAPYEQQRYYRLRYISKQDYTECIINPDGTQIWSIWTPRVTLQDAAALILHPVLGCVLRVRGIACLHASTMTAHDHCMAILGAPGAGKSSVAAMLTTMNYHVLGDDVTALDERGSDFWIQAGVPRVRVNTDSARAIHGDDVILEPVWSQPERAEDKGYFSPDNNDNSPLHATPLAAIYCLQPRERTRTEPQIIPAPAAERLMLLIQNAFGSYMLDQKGQAQQFSILGRLARHVPVRKVYHSEGLENLADTCRAISKDFDELVNHRGGSAI